MDFIIPDRQDNVFSPYVQKGFESKPSNCVMTAFLEKNFSEHLGSFLHDPPEDMDKEMGLFRKHAGALLSKYTVFRQRHLKDKDFVSKESKANLESDVPFDDKFMCSCVAKEFMQDVFKMCNVLLCALNLKNNSFGELSFEWEESDRDLEAQAKFESVVSACVDGSADVNSNENSNGMDESKQSSVSSPIVEESSDSSPESYVNRRRRGRSSSSWNNPPSILMKNCSNEEILRDRSAFERFWDDLCSSVFGGEVPPKFSSANVDKIEKWGDTTFAVSFCQRPKLGFLRFFVENATAFSFMSSSSNGFLMELFDLERKRRVGVESPRFTRHQNQQQQQQQSQRFVFSTPRRVGHSNSSQSSSFLPPRGMPPQPHSRRQSFSSFSTTTLPEYDNNNSFHFHPMSTPTSFVSPPTKNSTTAATQPMTTPVKTTSTTNNLSACVASSDPYTDKIQRLEQKIDNVMGYLQSYFGWVVG